MKKKKPDKKGEKPIAGVIRVRTDVIFGRDEICRHYNIGRRTLQHMIDNGLPYSRVGNKLTVNTRQVSDFVIKRSSVKNEP